MRSYRCGGFLPLFDRRDHLVAEAWDSRNVSGLLRVISKQAAERSHRLVNRVGGNRDTRPSLIEQLINADTSPEPGGKAEKKPQSAGIESDGFALAGHLARDSVNTPVTDTQNCCLRRHWRGFRTNSGHFRTASGLQERLRLF